MCHLIKDRPVAVSAQGVSHYNGDFEDVAYITVYFENPHLLAHFILTGSARSKSDGQ